MYTSFYKCAIRYIPCPEVFIVQDRKKINEDQTQENNLYIVWRDD